MYKIGWKIEILKDQNLTDFTKILEIVFRAKCKAMARDDESAMASKSVEKIAKLANGYTGKSVRFEMRAL